MYASIILIMVIIAATYVCQFIRLALFVKDAFELPLANSFIHVVSTKGIRLHYELLVGKSMRLYREVHEIALTDSAKGYSLLDLQIKIVKEYACPHVRDLILSRADTGVEFEAGILEVIRVFKNKSNQSITEIDASVFRYTLSMYVHNSCIDYDVALEVVIWYLEGLDLEVLKYYNFPEPDYRLNTDKHETTDT